MSQQPHHDGATDRRGFLGRVSAAAAGLGLAATAAAAADAPPAVSTLPEVPLGPHRISRLVAGWNPIGGHSHSTLDMARCMREYFTAERTVEFLLSCQREGVTAWQFDHTDLAVAVIRKLREANSPMKTICLHAERAIDVPVDQVVKDTGAIAIAHHGGVTDALFRAGKAQKVRDFVKKVKDQGILAGVSSHSPENVKKMADEGWENDFFMTCFYYLTRPRDEMEETIKKVPVGEPFFESDPVEMSAVIRQVGKTCLAFKILAAGRSCWSSYATEKAFQFAFKNIKPTDAMIVGMFPRYSDEVRENAELVRKHGAA